MVCRTYIKNISGTVNTTNSHLGHYCDQQNLWFVDNGNIKKSDSNFRGLYLHECGSSSKVKKNVLDFVY